MIGDSPHAFAAYRGMRALSVLGVARPCQIMVDHAGSLIRKKNDPCDGRHRVSGKARVPPAGREQPPIQSHVLSLGTDLRDFDQTLTLFQAVLPKTVLIPILRLSDRLLPSRVARWT